MRKGGRKGGKRGREGGREGGRRVKKWEGQRDLDLKHTILDSRLFLQWFIQNIIQCTLVAVNVFAYILIAAYIIQNKTWHTTHTHTHKHTHTHRPCHIGLYC